MAAEFNHECTDEIVCPHCGETQGGSECYDDGEWDCYDCDKPFVLAVHRRYSTTKAESMEGAES